MFGIGFRSDYSGNELHLLKTENLPYARYFRCEKERESTTRLRKISITKKLTFFLRNI